MHLRMEWHPGPDKYGRWPKNCSPSKALVGYVGPTCVAVARLHFRSVVTPAGTHWKAYGVGGLYVLPEWRSRGFAGRLLAEADQWASDRGAWFLATYGRSTRTLLKRLGYVAARCVDDQDALWVKSLDPGLAVLPGAWSVCPGDRF